MNKKNSVSNFRKKFHEFYSLNYQEELSSRAFMRISNYLIYFTGILGYKLSTIGTDLVSAEWNLLSLPLLISLFLVPGCLINLIHELQRDFYRGLSIIPSNLTAAVAMVQGFRTLQKEKGVKNLHACIYKLWDKELQNGIDDKIIKNARKYISFGKYYTIGMAFPLIPWLLRPFNGLFLYYSRNETYFDTRVLPVEYPFAVNNLWKWSICNIWEAFASIYVVIVVIGIDLRFIQLCALLSLMTQVVGHKFQNIVIQNDRTENDCRLVNRLHAIAKQHCEVIELSQRLEDIFNPILLVLMICISMAMGACVITVEKELSQNNYAAALTALAHFTAILIHTVAYCDTAENVCTWLEQIPRTIYESQWIGHSTKFHKRIILIMLRSQRQFKFRTYRIYTVDREQLKKIMLQAYNLLMMLRNLRFFKT